MRCAESCRDDGGLRFERDDGYRKTLEELLNDADRGVATTCRADETLGERRRCHCEAVAVFQCVTEPCPGRMVVCVVAIEEADDDARVEVDQSHSARNSSSSLLA